MLPKSLFIDLASLFASVYFQITQNPLLNTHKHFWFTKEQLLVNNLHWFCFFFSPLACWFLSSLGLSSRAATDRQSIRWDELVFSIPFHFLQKASLVAQMVKNLPATQEIQVQFLAQEDPLEKGMAEWQPTTVFLPGEFHRQRSLEGYIP